VQAVVERTVAAWFGVIRRLGPYLVLEIVLPGGTLIGDQRTITLPVI
jgi:hypothetical protein